MATPEGRKAGGEETRAPRIWGRRGLWGKSSRSTKAISQGLWRLSPPPSPPGTHSGATPSHHRPRQWLQLRHQAGPHGHHPLPPRCPQRTVQALAEQTGGVVLPSPAEEGSRMPQQPQAPLPAHSLPQCLLSTLVVTPRTVLAPAAPGLLSPLEPTDLWPPAPESSRPPQGPPRLPSVPVSPPLPRGFLREHPQPHRPHPNPPGSQKALLPAPRRRLWPPPP